MATVTHIIDKNYPIYATGDQTISGIKTFNSMPTVNGIGFLLSGSNTIVYTTGDQIINGSKTFTSGINIYSGTSPQSIRVFNSTGTNSGEFALFGWTITGLNTGWTGNVTAPMISPLIIGSQATNSGILRDIVITGNNINLIPNLSGNINFYSGNRVVSQIKTDGGLYFSPKSTTPGVSTYIITDPQDVLYARATLGGGKYIELGDTTYLLRVQNGSLYYQRTSTSFINLTTDSSNSLSLRNPAGNAPHSLKIFNLTGTNSGEYGLFGWDTANNLIIGSQATSSGILRNTSITGSNININSNSLINLNPSIPNNGYVTLNGNSAYLLVVNGGVNQAALGKHPLGTFDGLHLTQGRYVTWSSSQVNSNSPYLFLTDDGANILAQRNALSPTSSQQFRVYNSTGTNSGEFGLVGWINSGLVIGPQQSTSGILRNLILTGANININASGVLNVFDNTNIVGNLIVSGNATITGNLNSAGNYYVKVARLSNQTVLNGIDTGIQFSSVTDPNGWYNASTYRITPTVSGNYVTNLMVSWQKGTINNNQTNIQIRKNNNTIAINKSVIVTGDDFTSFATAITSLNGSSDYVDATAYTANPTSQVINGTADGAWTKLELFKLN